MTVRRETETGGRRPVNAHSGVGGVHEGLPGGFRVAVFERLAGIRMIGAPALTPQEVRDGGGTWS